MQTKTFAQTTVAPRPAPAPLKNVPKRTPLISPRLAELIDQAEFAEREQRRQAELEAMGRLAELD